MYTVRVYLPSEIIVAAVFAIVGASLGALIVWRSRRGRAIDDHPVCARCRFDLIHLAVGAKKCPECGYSLERRNSIQHGNRRLAVPMLVIGILIGAACIGVGGGYGWNHARTMTPEQWLPESVLLHALRQYKAATPLPELDELRNRLKSGTLSRKTTAVVAKHLLKVQADPNAWWLVQMGDFLDEAWHAGKLDAEDRSTFILNGIEVQVWARPIVHQAARLPLRVTLRRTRLGKHTSSFDLTYRMTSGALAGAAIDPAPQRAWKEWGSDELPLTAGEVASAVGIVEFASEWILETGPIGYPKSTRTIQSKQEILIVEPSAPLVLLRRDAAARRAIEAAFAPPQTVTLDLADPRFGFIFGLTPDTSKLRYPLAVEIWACDPSDPSRQRKWWLGTTTMHPAPNIAGAGMRTIVNNVDPKDIDLDTVDLILIPSLETAEKDWTIVEMFGDEIVLKGVSVNRPTSPSPAPP